MEKEKIPALSLVAVGISKLRKFILILEQFVAISFKPSRLIRIIDQGSIDKWPNSKLWIDVTGKVEHAIFSNHRDSLDGFEILGRIAR